MLLTKPQTQRFWREWSAIKRQLKASGSTDAQCENERYDMLQRAGFNSLTEVDTRSGFDAVLAQLGAMRDDVARTQEISDPTIGKSRRLREKIRKELLRCLALYEPDAEAYLQAVLRDKIRWYKTDQPTRPPTLDDLTATPTHNRRPPCWALKEGPSQLEQLMMTLNARIHTKRKAAGHTIHDMLTRAGLPCACTQCDRRSTRKPVPVIAREQAVTPAVDQPVPMPRAVEHPCPSVPVHEESVSAPAIASEPSACACESVSSVPSVPVLSGDPF